MAGPSLTLGSSRGRWVLAACVLGSGMAMLDGTVVNVALPTIGRELDADVADLQWVLNGYLLVLASLILVGGSLGDRLGRRRVFVAGVAWFAVASALCGAAPNVEVLIAARLLQGVGGALLTPGSLAIIESGFVKQDRGPAIGAWAALGGIAAAVGPLLGGWLIDAASWRAIFYLNLPVAAVVIAIAARHVPETRDETATGRIDWLGSAIAAATLGSITSVLIRVPDGGWTGLTVVLAVVGVSGAVAFLLVERRVPSPMLPLGVFSNRQFTAANLVTLAVYGSLGIVFFLLVIQLQTVLGYSPVLAGTALIPVTGLMLALSPASGALATRIGPRRPLTVGPLVIAVGMLLMTRIDAGAGYLGEVVPAVVVFGLGLVTTVTPVTATVLAAVDDAHAGVASGVNNAVSRTAQLLAVAAIPPLAGLTGDAFQEPAVFADGFRTAMTAAGLAVAGGVMAWLTISDDVLEDGDGEPEVEEPVPCRQCPTDGAPLRA